MEEYSYSETENQDLFFDDCPSIGMRPPKGRLQATFLAELNLDYKFLVENFNYDLETGKFTRYRVSNRSLKKTGDPVGIIYAPKSILYLYLFLNGRWFSAHRLAYLWVMGVPSELNIDHIDGNSLNNKWENIRKATVSQSNFNRGLNKNNKTGFKGVRQTGNKWTASIGINYEKVRLGVFDNPEEAHVAYVNAAKELHGEYARLFGITKGDMIINHVSAYGGANV